jgi:hypothetical protein
VGDGSLFAYAGSNPTSAFDPLGLTTLSMGVTVSGGAGAGGSFSLLFNADLKGNLSLTITPALGGYGGVGGSVGGTLQVTNGSTVSDLEGTGTSTGGSLGLRPGAGPFVGVDAVIQPTARGWSVSAGWTGGLTPVELHSLLGYTWAPWRSSIRELLRSLVSPPAPPICAR